MSSVFISYKRIDQDFVRNLHKELTERQIDVWVDFEDIPLTTEWWEEITLGIEQADVFIFVISPESVTQSPVARMEIDHAVRLNKKLIPILYRPLTTPEMWEALHPALKSHQQLDFSKAESFAAGFAQLLEGITSDVDYVRNHTRYLQRAREWEKANHDPSFILYRTELKEAEQWLLDGEKFTPPPSQLHRAYITASRRLTTRRRVRYTVITINSLIVTLLLIASVVFGLRAERRSDEANEQRQIAEENAELAKQEANEAEKLSLVANATTALTDNNTDLALALAREAVALEPDSATLRFEVERALTQAAYSPGTRTVLEGHNTAVYAVTITPDGTVAYSGDENGNLIVWDLTQNTLLTQTRITDREISALTIADNQLLIAVEGQVIVWDRDTQQTVRTFEEHTALVWDIVALSDGDTALSAGGSNGGGGDLIEWQISTGEIIRRFAADDTGLIRTLALSPDETTLLTGGNGIIVWDMATGEPITTLNQHTNVVNDIAYSPDSRYFVSGASFPDTQLILWDAETYQPSRIFLGHTNAIRSVAFTHDAHFVLSTGSDTSLRKWSVTRGNEVLQLNGHQDAVFDLALSADDELIITAALDGTLRLWDLDNGAEFRHVFVHALDTPNTSNPPEVYAVAYLPDGTGLLTGDADGNLILWDAQSGTALRQIADRERAINALAVSADGRLAASGGDDNLIEVWDITTGELLYTLEGHTSAVQALAFNPTGNYLVSGSALPRPQVIVWNLATRTALYTLDDHTNWVNTVAFSPDGSTFLSGSSDNSLILWDTATGQQIRTFIGHSYWVLSAVYTTDGQNIMSGSGDHTIRLWDINTGETIAIMRGHKGPVRSVVYIPNSTFILSGGADQTIRIWDMESGAEKRRFTGHTDAVRGLAYQPNAGVFASVGEDGALRFWYHHDLDALYAWIENNRFLYRLNCQEQQIYIGNPCDE